MRFQGWLLVIVWGLAAGAMPNIVSVTSTALAQGNGTNGAGKMISVELRLIKAPTALYKQIGAEARLAKGVVTLSKIELHCLMEAAHGWEKTDITQFPRIETTSGRSVSVRNDDLECQVLPELAADDTISLKISRTLSKERVRVTVDAELPNGRSVLLSGWNNDANGGGEDGMSFMLVATPRVVQP